MWNIKWVTWYWSSSKGPGETKVFTRLCYGNTRVLFKLSRESARWLTSLTYHLSSRSIRSST
ncbi:hypothetical protein PTKIN_Ptkin08bG0058200 [Pterospermum kingtungense]